MKRLDELGVSPAPWQAVWHRAMALAWVDSLKCEDGVAEMCSPITERCHADAALIAAAPSLYECLRNLIEACGAVGYKDGGTAACYESEHKLYRAIWDAEAALYKAGCWE